MAAKPLLPAPPAHSGYTRIVRFHPLAFSAALICLAGDAGVTKQKAARQIATVEGTYTKRIKSGTIDGSKYSAVDRLSIKRSSDTAIEFSLRLNFFNGHECSMEGSAEYQPDGSFVHREPLDPNRECVLKLVPTATDILIQDSEEQYCKLLSCGARGGYNGASFSRKLRQAPHPAGGK